MVRSVLALILTAALFLLFRLKLLAATLVLVTCAVFYCWRSSSQVVRLHEVDLGAANSVLLVEATLDSKRCLFMVDTGYAGAPVISTSYLTSKMSTRGTIAEQYERAVAQMQTVTDDQRTNALNAFMRESQCMSYTSGCTMRLMSVGATVEQRADMLLCPRLRLRTTSGAFSATNRRAHADIFVTHTLHDTVHILTSDFLLHAAPVLLRIDRQEMELELSAARRLSVAPGMHHLPLEMVGGSFVVPLAIEGVSYRFTLDTGAPGPICISHKSLRSIPDAQRIILQKGVNGERVCSRMVELAVRFLDQEFSRQTILVNDAVTEGVDGYIGLGFLRGFDILIDVDGLRMRRNRLPVRMTDYYTPLSTVGTCKF